MTRVTVSAASISRLRSEFDSTGLAYLPHFLSPSVLALLLKQIHASVFTSKNEIDKRSGAIFGSTFVIPAEDPAMVTLGFFLNRPELFDMAADVSGLAKPGNFVGRIHRTSAVSEQHIDWHGDAIETRMLGLNINLSSEPFTGGVFQLRDEEKRVTAEVTHTVPGDAFLFRIDGGWEHRLTKVAAGIRTVAVGWFRRYPVWTGWQFTPDAPAASPAQSPLVQTRGPQ